MNRKFLIWVPLIASLVIFGFFYAGLKNPAERVIASKLVGKPLPSFDTVAAVAGKPGAATSDFADGKPRLLNVFASWCVPCVAEIPVLMQLKAQGADIVGVAIHDDPAKLQEFLNTNGDPYSRIGLDQGGKAQIEIGSAGVPETFVVNGKGQIIHQHIGVVSEAEIPMIMAKLRGGQ